MKLADVDTWEPMPGDLFVLKANGASKRKFRLILAVGMNTVLVMAWNMGKFVMSESYSREWFENYRDYIAEVHRP